MPHPDTPQEPKRTLVETEEILSCLLAGTTEFIIIHNLNGRMREVNQAAVKGLGFPEEELIGMDIPSLLATPTPVDMQKAWKNLEIGTPFAMEGVLRRKNGSSFPAMLTFFPLAQGKEPSVLTIARDLSEHKAVGEALFKTSFRDPLTGLYNRIFFEEELKRLDCERQFPISVIMGNLNGLKMVNDAFGHPMGDVLLKGAAKVLRKICRSSDLLFRWYEDEFLILLPHTREEDAASVVGRIEKAFQNLQAKNMPISPSMSLGYATKTHRWQNFDNVLKDAEEDMQDKRSVKNSTIREAMLENFMYSLAATTPETREHVDHVRAVARFLGTLLHLNRRNMENLDLASRFHDIGKAILPPRLLSKTTPLSDKEWEDIRKHAEAGYHIAESSTSDVAAVADEILSHHERWDGTGYPSGLSGEKIPFLSRIIALADAFDVMTRGTPYKLPLSRQETMEEISRLSGTQFDPQLAFLLLENIESFDAEAVNVPPYGKFAVE